MKTANKIKRKTAARGERQGCAKLTEIDVQEILRLLSSGTRQVDLAKRFGVSQPAISHIKTGENWKHVK